VGKSKEIRKRTLLERLASERHASVEREKVLSGAVTKLRAALVEYAKGDKWARKFTPASGCYPWRIAAREDIIWLGKGLPEELAKAAIVAVFGKEHPLTGLEVVRPQEQEDVHLQGQGEPEHGKE